MKKVNILQSYTSKEELKGCEMKGNGEIDNAKNQYSSLELLNLLTQDLAQYWTR